MMFSRDPNEGDPNERTLLEELLSIERENRFFCRRVLVDGG